MRCVPTYHHLRVKLIFSSIKYFRWSQGRMVKRSGCPFCRTDSPVTWLSLQAPADLERPRIEPDSASRCWRLCLPIANRWRNTWGHSHRWSSWYVYHLSLCNNYIPFRIRILHRVLTCGPLVVINLSSLSMHVYHSRTLRIIS